MGCCGDREKAIAVSEEQKWDYITLSDFKSRSCLTPLSYAWLWILVIISGAVYAADAFTAVNLLAFNKWSSEVKPKVSFDVAKWIFAVCIILSYVFLVYRWIRAWRVIRSGSVTESYLEPLAAIFQSMRITRRGQGWRRFLVFAELTHSRKGADYLALFVYFQFKGALLIILAQGPRMAINALTLWAVMQAQLIPVGDHAAPKNRSPVVQFFMNIETMTKTGNTRETVIYFSMLFSLVIWVIAALSLMLSVIFYIFFLWHYIPSADGTLTQYCRRKVETRLEKVVSKKVKKALEKEDQKRRKEESGRKKKGDAEGAQRAPTLPKLGELEDDTASVFSTSTTTTALPPYTPHGPTRTNTTSTNTSSRTLAMTPSLPSLSERPVPNRSDTSLTYASDAPLLSEAGGMGMSSPVPPMPQLDREGDYFQARPGPRPMPRGPPGRPFSPMSQGRASPHPQRGPLPPVNTSFSDGRGTPSGYLISPQPSESGARNPPYPSQARLADPTFSPYDNRAPRNGPAYEMSPVDMTPVDNRGPQEYEYPGDIADEYQPPQLPNALRPASPAQHTSPTTRVSPAPLRAGTAPPNNPRAGLPAALQSAIQRREASQPLPNRGPNGMMQQQRSATAPIQQPGWGQDPYARSNTTTPGARGYNGY